LGFGEDSHFRYQMDEAGFKVEVHLECAIEHHFDAARLSRRAFLNRGYGEGRSIAFSRFHRHGQLVRWALLYSVKRRLRLLYERCRHISEVRTAEGIPLWELDIVTSIGFFDEMWRMRKLRQNRFELSAGRLPADPEGRRPIKSAQVQP
jgi:hypothetical protein